MPTQKSKITPARRAYSGVYTIGDTALYLRATTPPPEIPLKVWLPKRRRFIRPSSRHLYAWIRRSMEWEELAHTPRQDLILSFGDLVRLRMIVIMRSRGVAPEVIRESEDYARKLTGRPQPFVTERLWTSSSDVFFRLAEFLIAASKKGQLAMDFLEAYLMPVNHGLVFGPDELACAWSPVEGVIIDPAVQFGAPCIEGTRIQTEAVWALSRAGESAETLARMYQVEHRKIEAALEWEETLDKAA